MPDGVNIPGGPSFVGTPQPPDVPCDPTGEAWRGPPGPPGPMPPGGPFLPLSGGTITGRVKVQLTPDWLNGWNALVSTVYVLSPGNGTALTGASYSTPAGGAIGLTGIGYNQTASNPAWGGYFEARQYPGAGTYTQGIEVDVCNVSGVDAVAGNPYAPLPQPATPGIVLQSGGGVHTDTPPLTAKYATCAMQIGPNDSRFLTGITFNAYGLVGTDGTGTGTANALALATGHTMQWWMPSHVAGPLITSMQVSGTPAQLIFENNGSLHLYGGFVSDSGLMLPNGATASGYTDFSKGIDLSGSGLDGINALGGISLNARAGGAVNFAVNGAAVGYIGSTGMNYIPIGQGNPAAGAFTVLAVGSTTGPTWTTGSGVPSSTQPVGSLYSRVGGAVGATLYVSRGAGTWAAVSGV